MRLEKQILNVTEDELPGDKSRENMQAHVYASQFLRKASRRILNQQNAVIEEQRFHALFQMLSLILHELNQPLTSLMGNIELMKFYEDKPDKIKKNLQRINDAGKRMSGIVKKLQDIRNGTHSLPVDPFQCQAAEKKFTVLALVNSDENFSRIRQILNRHMTVDIHRIYEEDDALLAINNKTAQLIIMDDDFLVLPGMRLLTHIKKHFFDIPIVFIVGKNREILALKAIGDGVEACLFESDINQESLVTAILHAMEAVAVRQQLDLAVHKMADVSVRDNLTGLFQDRYFRDAVDREIIRAKRDEYSFCVCKIQLDDFDKINDNLNKERRDRLIVDMSQMLQRNLGEKQILSRYEKGAFAFLLNGDSQKKVEEIRGECSKLLSDCWENDPMLNIRTTVSVGVSQFNPSMSCSAYDLIKKAGEDLKQDQKNRQQDEAYVSKTPAPSMQQRAISEIGS